MVERTETIRYIGRVQRVQGLLIESSGPQAVIGEVCQIELSEGGPMVWGEVVGLRGRTVQLMPFAEVTGIQVGLRVIASGSTLEVPVVISYLPVTWTLRHPGLSLPQGKEIYQGR